MTEDEQELMELRRQIHELEARVAALRTPPTSNEVAALEALQARADSVATKFGERAPAPQLGERPDAYRVRLLRGLQRFSPTFADFRLDSSTDEALLATAEEQIFRDAERAGRSGAEVQGLVRIDSKNAAGQTVTTYFGDPLEWMRPFMSGGAVCRITRPGFEE